MKGLRHALEQNPDVEVVYFTEEMDGWLLNKNNRHPKEMSREDCIEYLDLHPETENVITFDAEGDDDRVSLLEEENNNLIAENQELTGKLELLGKRIEELLTLNAELTTENDALRKQLDEQI